MTDLPYAKKSLGQHWLTDTTVLETIANEANVITGDHVLEIGPGAGTLTRTLLMRGADVTAVERDITLVTKLQRELPEVKIVSEDILKFNFSDIKGDYKIVANIPYYLTSNLIRIISEVKNRPNVAVLLVQKEVAERAAAQPGSMSMLSVSAQFYWEVHLGVEVPARMFIPPPKVDSRTLILKKRNQPLFNDVDEKQFFRLVKAGFSNRRKTLLNSLSGGLQMGKDEVRELLKSAELKETARPQELSLKNWESIYSIFVAKQG